jgi:hypothetical protein
MADKPDDRTPSYPGGAFAAFTETELVGFDPRPLGAVYDGVTLRLSPSTAPAEPPAIAEGAAVPAGEEPASRFWIGSQLPPKRMANAARLRIFRLSC